MKASSRDIEDDGASREDGIKLYNQAISRLLYKTCTGGRIMLLNVMHATCHRRKLSYEGQEVETSSMPRRCIPSLVVHQDAQSAARPAQTAATVQCVPSRLRHAPSKLCSPVQSSPPSSHPRQSSRHVQAVRLQSISLVLTFVLRLCSILTGSSPHKNLQASFASAHREVLSQINIGFPHQQENLR